MSAPLFPCCHCGQLTSSTDDRHVECCPLCSRMAAGILELGEIAASSVVTGILRESLGPAAFTAPPRIPTRYAEPLARGSEPLW